MSVQITVRLPHELVSFLDDLVAAGSVRSRAEGVTHSLARERRFRSALNDVAILRDLSTDPDLDELASYQAAHPVALDD